MTIRQVQCLLLYLGYDPGPIDGLDGPKTKAAVAAFQRAKGLRADGAAGETTRKALLEAVCSEKAGTFWDETPNFTRQEFACPCPRCGGFPAEPAEGLVRAAQALREKLGVPIILSSGVRCPAHNAEVGGVANSRHLLGHAMDFRAVGKSAAQVLPMAQTISGIVYAYAIDGSYVHMDIGG